MNTLTRRALNTASIPRDLESVTTINAAAEVAPALAGVSAGTLDNVWHSVERLYRTGVHPGM